MRQQRWHRRRSWSALLALVPLCLPLLLLLLLFGPPLPFVVAKNQACTKCETSAELAVCANVIKEDEPVFLTRDDCQGGTSATARVNSIVDGSDKEKSYRQGTDNCRDLTIEIMCRYVKVATTGFKFDTCPVSPMCQKDCEVIKECQIDMGAVNCRNGSPLVVADSLSEAQDGWKDCPKLSITPVRDGREEGKGKGKG